MPKKKSRLDVSWLLLDNVSFSIDKVYAEEVEDQAAKDVVGEGAACTIRISPSVQHHKHIHTTRSSKRKKEKKERGQEKPEETRGAEE